MDYQNDNIETGLIFDIKKNSVHDGPGTRAAFYFKGCNLRCFWCNSPESYDARRELNYYKDKCVGCEKCAQVCIVGSHTFVPRHIGSADHIDETLYLDNEIHADESRHLDNELCADGALYLDNEIRADVAPHLTNEIHADGARHFINRSLCTRCGVCVKVCGAGALSMTGAEYSLDEAIEAASENAELYKRSGGGITCTGGEPLLQAGFVERLLRASKEAGLHTAIDTAGHVNFSVFEQVLPYTDLILYDVKCADTILHHQVTGVKNRLIIENLKRLSERGTPVWIRVPVVPGINDNDANMRATAKIVSELGNVKRVELLPYNSLGAGKYERLGMDVNSANVLQPVKNGRLEQIKALFESAAYDVVVNQYGCEA